MVAQLLITEAPPHLPEVAMKKSLIAVDAKDERAQKAPLIQEYLEEEAKIEQPSEMKLATKFLIWVGAAMLTLVVALILITLCSVAAKRRRRNRKNRRLDSSL